MIVYIFIGSMCEYEDHYYFIYLNDFRFKTALLYNFIVGVGLDEAFR